MITYFLKMRFQACSSHLLNSFNANETNQWLTFPCKTDTLLRHDDKTPPGMARALLRAHQSSQNKAFFKKEGSEARYFVTLYKPTEKTSDLNSITKATATHRFAPSCIQGVITSYSFLTGPSLMHPMKAFVGRHVHQYCMKRLKLLRIVKGI